MVEIQELIQGISKRPKMYLAEVKIEYIYYLLEGYCYVNNKMHGEDMDAKFCYWFWKWLGVWIIENVNSNYMSETVFWYEDIKKIVDDEEDEVPLFFELCALFFEDYNKKRGYFEWRNSMKEE